MVFCSFLLFWTELQLTNIYLTHKKGTAHLLGCFLSETAKKPYLYHQGIDMVFDISFISTETISILVWYRYGFLLFFAVLDRTLAN